MSEDPKPPSELVAGKYELTRLLGRGGMGSVWEGVHATLGTRVACKFIEAEYAGSREARERFENEARAAASLRSKHVVEVYDHGVMGDGRPYIVMEFLRGEPLDKRLDRQGVLSLTEMATILQHVARALTRAHSVGIIHRDLKPENVFLVWDEEDQADIAKVVDFGIAKFTDESMGISSQTRTGSVLGTPYYMSPEQARGLRSVDTRSDLWSLGIIAFQCLTGSLPFTGEAVGDLLVRICTSDPPTPSSLRPGLPPEVDTWMRRALGREPEQRFSSAKEMADAFAVIAGVPMRSGQSSAYAPGVDSGGHSATNATLVQTAGALTNAGFERDARRSTGSAGNKGLLIGGGVVVAMALVGIGVAVLSRGGDDATAAGGAAPETAQSAQAAQQAQPTEPHATAAETAAPAKEPEKEAPAPVPAKADEKPDAKPSAKATAKPSRATTQAAQPTPTPKPATTPRRSSDIDLGY
jgi:serine/threonine-protein kinase